MRDSAWRAPRTTFLGGLLLLGCHTGPVPTAFPAVDRTAAAALADLAGEIVNQAMRADARLEAGDSLYAPGALIVADGERRNGLPRFAGIRPGGQVSIASSRVDITHSMAWVYAEYRWVATEGNQAGEGRATVVLVPALSRPGWWIVHVHSSSMR